MPDLVISNTSPLFYLHRLRIMDVLRELYGHILIPEAVLEELKAGAKQGEYVPDMADYTWIEVRPISAPAFAGLIMDLGMGEAEVLTLAIENPDSLMLLDDGLAREIARARNMRFTGTAGILLKAKEEGLIQAVKPLLKMLIELGFWLSSDLINIILELAHEKDFDR